MDKGASVIAKLKAKSKQTGKSLQMHLQFICCDKTQMKLKFFLASLYHNLAKRMVVVGFKTLRKYAQLRTKN